MSSVLDAPQSEDRALLHLVAMTDAGIKGIVLDLIRSSEGKFQNAPLAIRRLMEDLFLGMRLNGASDQEIEQRFDLGRGGASLLERALLRHVRTGQANHGQPSPPHTERIPPTTPEP